MNMVANTHDLLSSRVQTRAFQHKTYPLNKQKHVQLCESEGKNGGGD